MDHHQAVGLFDALVKARINASLTFAHHPKMTPADNFQVQVPIGPGSSRITPERLAKVMDIAAEHETEVHVIGAALLLVSTKTRALPRFNRG